MAEENSAVDDVAAKGDGYLGAVEAFIQDRPLTAVVISL